MVYLCYDGCIGLSGPICANQHSLPVQLKYVVASRSPRAAIALSAAIAIQITGSASYTPPVIVAHR
jgi:hypothetical protein